MYLVGFGKGWLLAVDETWTILKTTAASIFPTKLLFSGLVKAARGGRWQESLASQVSTNKHISRDGKINHIEHSHKNGLFENYNCLKSSFLGALTPTKAVATTKATTSTITTKTTTTTTTRSKPFSIQVL